MLLGGGAGVGIVLAARSLRGTAGPTTPSWMRRAAVSGPQLFAGGVGAVVALVLTRWPVAVVAGGLLGIEALTLLGARERRNQDAARSEAVASWTELLRDTMGAAVGLEQAIRSTAVIAPLGIRPQVRSMVARLEHERLAPSLAALAQDLADTTADLVVTALILAANGEAQDLGELLGSLAEAARDSATLRLRVEASRARIRTSVRIIASVTVGMVILLVVLNREYLRPFDSIGGQAVLGIVVGCWITALWWLMRMSRFTSPERFLTGSGEQRSTA